MTQLRERYFLLSSQQLLFIPTFFLKLLLGPTVMSARKNVENLEKDPSEARVSLLHFRMDICASQGLTSVWYSANQEQVESETLSSLRYSLLRVAYRGHQRPAPIAVGLSG